MSSPLLAALRQRTAPLHARLDAALNDAPPTRASYVAFLRATLAAQRRVLPAIARWIARPDDAQRLASLRADLAALDAAPHDEAPVDELTLPPAGAYGAAYVVEGSTLGGLVLAERFEAALGLPPDTATRYLRLHGRDTAARWRAFLADLSQVADPVAHEEACQAAIAAFEAYRAAFVAHGVIRDD